MAKVWFITGSSRGFGEEIVRTVLAHGDRVVATARDPSVLDKKFGENDNLLKVKLDVTNEKQAMEAAKSAIDRFGQIDVLVSNAGYGIMGAVEEASDEEIKKMYETNVFGLLGVVRAVLPEMRKQHFGYIFNISSVGGYQSGPNFGLYCSTKFAVEAISEAMHAELAPLGIHVTVIEPGYFRTDFLDSSSLVESKKVIPDYAQTVGQMRQRAREKNQKQPGDPAKLALALIKLTQNKNPPLRLPLGKDSLQAIENKNSFVANELQTWRELSTSTDFS